MANLDSFTKQAIHGVIKEHDRTANTYKNDVDFTRSHLNFSYGVNGAHSKEIKSKIKQRCDAIMDGRRLQDTANVMCEWVVTFPFDYCTPTPCYIYKKDKKTVRKEDGGKPVAKMYNKPNDPAQVKQFFDEVYDFVCERYGTENIMGAYVHMDEKTPQMHIDFVPEAISRKTGLRTVSSASRITRGELHSFHTDLDKRIESTLGMKKAILNGRTKGDFTVEELKERERVENEIAERMLKAKEVEQRANDKYSDAIKLCDELDKQQEELTQEREEFYAERRKKTEELKEREKSVSDRENKCFNVERANAQAIQQINLSRQQLEKERAEFNEQKEDSVIGYLSTHTIPIAREKGIGTKFCIRDDINGLDYINGQIRQEKINKKLGVTTNSNTPCRTNDLVNGVEYPNI